MPRVIASIAVLLLVSLSLYAQNPIAQLKFEDAEKAFNAGDFSKALHYVDETEKLVGVTSKTLYLRIVAQDGLLAAAPAEHRGLMASLKTNVEKYLTALKDQEIDEKYRTVYAISKKWESGGSNQPARETSAGQTSFLSGSGNVAEVLQAYQRAVWGAAGPAGVHTVMMEQEMYNDGILTSNMRVKRKVGKSCITATVATFEMKMVYRDGTGYTMVGDAFKAPMTGDMLESSKAQTVAGQLLTQWFEIDEFVGARATQGMYKGVPVDALVIPDRTVYFDRVTHLLIAQKETNEQGVVITADYQDYRRVNGVQFPFTVVVSSVGEGSTVSASGTVSAQASQAEPSPSSQSAAVGLLSNNRNRTKKQGKQKAMGMVVMAATRPPANEQNASSAPGGVNAQEGTSGAGRLSGSPLPPVSSAPQAGPTSTTMIKIKSLVINQPIPDEVFQ